MKTGPSFPRKRRAVRGKLGIGELQLVGRVGPGFGGVDVWRSVDFGDGLSREQTACDQVGEADCRHCEAALAGCDAQQEVRDYCRHYLETDGILGAAEELSDFEMLLDPAEQELDLPPGFIKRGDFRRLAIEIVSDDRQDA